MAAPMEARGLPTYPVWVGDLQDNVNENDLLRIFTPHGTIANCKIMRDENGVSKHFGYVNFLAEDEAETAARSLSGFQIEYHSIKTKGPKKLKEEKHLQVHVSPSSGRQMFDYRPLTDCSFGQSCKKGQKCPYRHVPNMESNPLCPQWQAKNCYNADCVYRHPGGKEGSKEPSPQPLYATVGELVKCDGRCGLESCKAHFQSQEDLANHIRLTRKPQCRHCRAIFMSEADYLEHKMACPARLISDSTDRSSESADIEQLTDSSETDEEAPLTISQYLTHSEVQRSSSAQAIGKGSPTKNPRKLSAGAEVKAKRRHRGRRAGRKGSNTSATSNGNKTDSDMFTMAVGALNEGGLSFSQYEITREDSDSDSDVEPNEDGTHRPELNSLMSVNEMDMYDSDENEDVESKASKAAHKKSPAHSEHVRGRLEPVGVFWDIENCPVPQNKSAFSLAGKIRNTFFQGKREAEFMCVCDITKERKEVMDALNKAHVTLVHVSAVAKNAADDKLRQSLRRFAHTYPPPSTVVLISGDVNFSPELNDLRYIHNITIVLLHSSHASVALKDFANTAIDFESFIADVGSMTHTPKQPILSRIVIVSNIPRGPPIPKIKNRLDQLSDNCGGKVLKVDPDRGTARILYRTNDWAVKSMKRMNGENVFGLKIKTQLEPPSLYDTKIQQMQNISGPDLARSFPPRAPPHPANVPGFRSPNLPQRRMDHYPPPRGHPSNAFPPPRVMYAPPPPRPHINMAPRFPPSVPGSPPSSWNPTPLGLQLPPGPIKRPDGKILVYKIPPVPEADIDKLNGHVVSFRLAASVKASHLILWHSYSELQVLLKVDFIQTALVRREEMVRTLYERGELRPEIAKKFLEDCVASLLEVGLRQALPWDVTLCGWTPDEEEERVVRSKVIHLLRQNVPTYWTKWANFKKRYLDMYSTAISEMAVHNACRGAVQILGDTASTQSQVIVFYELSPLLKLGMNPQVHSVLIKKFETFLHSLPDKKVKLLDFVLEFVNSGGGRLPHYTSGKLLQELLGSIPNVSLVGGRPSTISVVLSPHGVPQSMPPAQAPKNLSGISAAFLNLIMHSPYFELPFSRFQQEYQTFYHKSFRVADYIKDGSTARDLILACDGITLKDVPRPSGKIETMVVLQQLESTPQKEPLLPRPQPTAQREPLLPRPTTPVKTVINKPKDISALSKDFVNFLKQTPNNELPLRTFQQSFQSFYHRSGFRVSDYLPESNSTRQLIEACPGVMLWEVQFRDGKTETMVRLSTEVKMQPKQKISLSSAASISTEPPLTASASPQKTDAFAINEIPKKSVKLFKKDCIEVLSSLPERKTLLTKYPVEYLKLKQEQFSLAKYNAKKLVHLMQAIPDVVKLTGDRDLKLVELIDIPEATNTDSITSCEKRVERLLYSLPNHQITLDRFMFSYENCYGERLQFYGHPKLLKLLENLPNSTLQFEGEGAQRKVFLAPLTLFGYEIEDLLSVHRNGLPISSVVPAYKERFGKSFQISKYGVPKLIKALEAITDVIELKGEGASRTVHLKPQRGRSRGRGSAPALSMLPEMDVLVDEVTALMVSRNTNTMTLSNLTKKYNDSFRLPNNQPVEASQLQMALKQLSNFKVTATQVEWLQLASPPAKKQSATKPPPVPSPPDIQMGKIDFDEMPALISASPSKAKTTESPFGSPQKDPERLASETKRLLLRHREHAQTLSELAACFREARDPAHPTAETMYESLCKRTDRFEIGYIKGSVGDSLVQLNRQDCLFKLSLDLQYLFVHCPSSAHSMQLSELEVLYADCFGHKLSCAVYGSPTVELLFDHQPVKNVVKFEPTTRVCSLTDTSRQLVLVFLLSELIFVKGHNRTLPLTGLPKLYREYFGCHLSPSSFGMKKIVALFQLPKVKQNISLDSSNSTLVLRIPNYAAEQLRHLLTINNGRLPFNELEAKHEESFGYQDGIDIQKIGKTLVQTASNVVNFAGNKKWLVWAPSGRPYPPHRRAHALPPTDNGQLPSAGNSVEWPCFDSVAQATPTTEHPPVDVSTTDNGQLPNAGNSVEWPCFDSVAQATPATKNSPVDVSTTDNGRLPNAGNNFEWPCFESVAQATPATKHSPVDVSVVTTTQTSTVATSITPPTTMEGPPPLLICNKPIPAPRTLVPSDSAIKNNQDEVQEDTFTTALAESSFPSTISKVSDPTDLPSTCDELKSLLEATKCDSPVTPPLEVTVDPSPYGFLEKELGPELMAELISNAHSFDDNIASESQPDLFDYLDDDLPPPSDPSLDDTLEKLILVSEAMARGEPLPKFGKEEEEKVERTVLDDSIEPIDYLTTGMNPEQVLEEFKKAKERSGGALTPSLMDPFLTYFGELSGQAIEQLEAEERKKKPKKAPRKKPTMAIRFPGQPPLGTSASQSATAAAISSDNDRSSFSSSSGVCLSQNSGSDEGHGDKHSHEMGAVSSHMTEPESISESQKPGVGDTSQFLKGNISVGSSSKIASIREKSVSDWRPFLLAAVDYTPNREAVSSGAQESVSESTDSVSDVD